MTNIAQIGTSFPGDNKKQIDYVIVYSNPKGHQKNIQKEKFQKLFIENLIKETIEIFDLKLTQNNVEFVYLLLHCPFERLLQEAETIKLNMKLKTNELNHLNDDISEYQLLDEEDFPLIKKIESYLSPPIKKDSNEKILTTIYDSSMKYLFKDIENDDLKKNLFSTTMRSLLVDEILNNLEIMSDSNEIKKNSLHQTVVNLSQNNQNEISNLNDNPTSLVNNELNLSNKEKTELLKSLNFNHGLQYMLSARYFDDAFILHDESDHMLQIQQLLENAKIISKDQQNDAAVSIYRNFKTEGGKTHRDIRDELNEKWGKLSNMFKFQPFWLIRNYFGESITFYFAWVGCLISSLWIPSIIGIIFFSIGIGTSYTNSNSANGTNTKTVFTSAFDNDLTPYYALLISLWGSFFIEFWKRQNAKLAFDFDVLKFEKNERELPEYRQRQKELEKRLKNRSPYIKLFYSNEIRFKMIVSYLILLLMICIVAIDIGVISLYRIHIYIKVFPNNPTYQNLIGDFGSTILNAIFVLVLNFIYTKIAYFTTEWENHRTRTIFEDNHIYKKFAFEFVNNYGSLFYIAFFRNIKYPNGIFNVGSEYQDFCDDDNCMSLLTMQILVMLILKPLPSMLFTVIWPGINMAYKKIILNRIANTIGIQTLRNKEETIKKNDEKHVYIYATNEKNKSDVTKTIYDEYQEKVILFGYVMLFACSFSLGPIILLIICLFDIRIDAQRLLWLFRRPVGYKAQDIGSWFDIIRFLNIAGIISNGLIIAFTSNWSKTFLKDNLTNRLIFFVAFEHVVFFLWFLITILIPDVSRSTRIKMRMEQEYLKEIIRTAKTVNSETKNMIQNQNNTSRVDENLNGQTITSTETPFIDPSTCQMKTNIDSKYLDHFNEKNSNQKKLKNKEKKEKIFNKQTEIWNLNESDFELEKKRISSNKHKKLISKLLPIE